MRPPIHCRPLCDDERSYRIGSGVVGAAASVFGVGALRGGGGGGGGSAGATVPLRFSFAGAPGFSAPAAAAVPQVAAPALTGLGLGVGSSVLMMSGLGGGPHGGGSSGGGSSGGHSETPPPTDEGTTPAEQDVKLLPPHDPNQVLNLGSGRNPMPGAVNIDPIAHPSVDVVASAENLPFGNEYFKEVVSINPHNPTLPPGEFFNPLEGDVSRVLQPGGRVTVVGQRASFSFREISRLSDDQLTALGFRRLGDVGPVEARFIFGAPQTIEGNPIFLGLKPSGAPVGLQLSFEKIP